MTNDYVPIGCDQHSVLELLAMRHAGVEVGYVDDSGKPLSITGSVTDVVTRDGGEFLVVAPLVGAACLLRLDRLREVRDRSGRSIWRQNDDVRH